MRDHQRSVKSQNYYFLPNNEFIIEWVVQELGLPVGKTANIDALST